MAVTNEICSTIEETNMVNTILPKLIKYLVDKGLTENEIREVSLNEKHDGSYVLINHRLDYCKTNQNRKDIYLKQFHAFKAVITNDWEEKNSGCNCTIFKKLTLDNLKSNWENDLVVQKRGSRGFFKAASPC